MRKYIKKSLVLDFMYLCHTVTMPSMPIKTGTFISDKQEAQSLIILTAISIF